MAGDRHYAASERRRDVARVTVCGDHHIARRNGTTAGLAPPLGTGTVEAAHRSFGADGNAAAAARFQKTLVVKRGVQFARSFDDHAAEIIVAGDLLALALARH